MKPYIFYFLIYQQQYFSKNTKISNLISKINPDPHYAVSGPLFAPRPHQPH